NDPFGGNEPVPGATLTYSLVVTVNSPGVAVASTVRDAIPTFTSYVPNSITLDSVAMSDVADTDEGEFDTSGVPSVVVRLGDLTQAAGARTIEFQVVID
ncbi:MAG: hypothetical protein WBM76_10130, partial [Woeseiaceae bacterium]